MAATVDASRVTEHYDEEEYLAEKIQHLANLVNAANGSVVFYTGAGVSTSAGIADYRGPSGCWTIRKINELEAKKKQGKLTSAEAAELAGLEKERKQEQPKSENAPEERYLHQVESSGAKLKENNATTSKRSSMLAAQPTLTHMAMSTLVRRGMAQHVVTTNLDGIHRKSGLKAHTSLTELHGCIYAERCTNPACGAEFERNYHVRSASFVGVAPEAKSRHVHDHYSGVCAVCGSHAPESYTGSPVTGRPTGADGDGFQDCHLVGVRDVNVGCKDTHINFGECLDNIDLGEADQACRGKELCIVAGTSMSLRHVTHLPFLAKKTVIINLQNTPDDTRCLRQDNGLCRIYSTCDVVFDCLMRHLTIPLDPVPAWRPKDAVPLEQMRPRATDATSGPGRAGREGGVMRSGFLLANNTGAQPTQGNRRNFPKQHVQGALLLEQIAAQIDNNPAVAVASTGDATTSTIDGAGQHGSGAKVRAGCCW